ncbi:ATP-binding cassette sub-family A member 3-like isoform X2 [Photinus pyralis]|nr:ATP-binding cassette sub-family A member 3-like isoform X2 [Photinus pyralis]
MSWKTDEIFPVYYTPGLRSPTLNEGGPPSYRDEGFLMLQEQLSLSVINHYKETINGTSYNRSSTPIFMQRFPYPKYTTDLLLSSLDIFIGIVFMVSFVYPCINTVRIIATEKEKQLKEAMKIMGLPNWLHWTAWFCKSLIMMLISLILMVALLKAPWYPGTEFTIFTFSNPIILFIFLVLFACSLITFSFAVSAMFSKANTAATFAGIAWFMLYAPYMAFQYKYDELSLAEKLLASLCSNSALALGMKLIVKMESAEIGLQWYTIWTHVQGDDLLFGYVLIMLAIDAVLYLLIALYVESVFPGDYGIAQPWYFPFLPSYWFGSSVCESYQECKPLSPNANHEKEPTHLHPGIQIKAIGKVYSNKKVAVDGFSLNMYRDQITVLLGHNGAGKTTLMSMLTGMIPPTSGTATIGGYDIRNNIKGVRNSLGICPQHNILFDELTVEEHLYFYSKLKGVTRTEVNKEIEKYIGLLKLTDKTKTLAGQLSGGMKRKLSVGVALCGNSRVVMCDEPTAGMDPSARRALWDLLLKQKKDRTILLTTHFMDEADLLGDRIAIMAGGKLECSGSSFFLKKQYGAGYQLILDKSPECNIESVTALLGKYIPNITATSNIGSELTYILNESYNNVFESMLGELEQKSVGLGVRSYGVSLTTLEEVFMKVGADHSQAEVKNAPEETKPSPLDVSFHVSGTNEKKLDAEFLTGFALWLNQINAMFRKRGLSILRSWLLFIIQNSIPVVFLVLTVIIAMKISKSPDQPMIRIRLNRYINPITTMSRHHASPHSQSFLHMLANDKYIVRNWENVTDMEFSEKMIEESENNMANYNTRYIAGASFKENNSITAWFSNQPFHGAPLALQLVMNAILQSEVTPNNSISVLNWPLPQTISTQFSSLYSRGNMGFQISFNLGFGMAFVSAFYILFYIRERSAKFKHLQFVSGANVSSFWIPSFICDVITFIFTSLCIIVTLAIFQKEGFSSAEDLSRVFALLLAFGFGSLPLTYLASFLFDVPTSGYTRLSLFNIIFGCGCFMIVEILKIQAFKLTDIAETLHQIFLIMPHYCLSSGLRDMSVLHTSRKLCQTATDVCTNFSHGIIPFLPNITIPPQICGILVCLQFKECCETTTYFAMKSPGVGQHLLYSCSFGIICFILLFAIEYGFFEALGNLCRRRHKNSHSPIPANITEDDDVSEEQRAVAYNVSIGNMNKYNLVMHRLSKSYKDLVAVDDISLGINKCECFGLLGVNGAGKTTTFKMVTGDIKMTSGDVWVNGWSVRRNLKEVYQVIGYCPQFDALLDDLTCRETLTIFGLLRGIKKRQCSDLAEHLAEEFDFFRHLDKKVKELSGGNKRKLSTALALVGDPLVLYLDEPTAGVDPATKRYLWNALCKIRDRGKTIVLTSHSMEECEALCTRMAIMVNGRIKCLGSTQHLKSKFSDGYTLTLKVKQLDNEELRQAAIEQIENFIKQNFPETILREKHQELLTFYITDKSRPWSKMFGIMERAKTAFDIEDYSLGQCTLEQVFLTFAKYQREE